jgi:hypothetical protein
MISGTAHSGNLRALEFRQNNSAAISMPCENSHASSGAFDETGTRLVMYLA